MVGGGVLSLLAFYFAVVTAPQSSAADATPTATPQSVSTSRPAANSVATPTPRGTTPSSQSSRVRPFATQPSVAPAQANPPRLRSRGS
jgi:hypothetical protein